MPSIDPVQASPQYLAPPTAMQIVALERENLHEKIIRLRALREAAEGEDSSAKPKMS